MAAEYLSPTEAARLLGITVPTLYDWLSQSDYGLLQIRGERVTVDYLQAGPSGQGRIRIAASEVERLLELMRVIPKRIVTRRLPSQQTTFPGITVPLGRPDRA
jgi:excisionase family DNA binding protein